MWFRVELHKDGSVASCTEVESSFHDTRLVRYVEADTKELAVIAAKAWYERYKVSHDARRRREKKARRAAGICSTAGCYNAPADGRKQCRLCLDRQKEYRERREAEGPRKRVPLGPLEFKKRRQEARKEYYCEVEKKNSRINVLREVLGHYESMTPDDFKAWLTARVEELAAAEEKRLKFRRVTSRPATPAQTSPRSTP